MIHLLLNKLCKNNIDTITLSVGGHDRQIFIDPDDILQKLRVSKSKYVKDFQILFFPKTRPKRGCIRRLQQKKESLLLKIKRDLKTPWASLLGIMLLKTQKKEFLVHYSEDLNRVKHIIRLANAFYLTIFTILKKQVPTDGSVYRKGNKVMTFGHKGKSRTPILMILKHLLKVVPKGLLEKDLIKIIKLSLTGKFAQIADQELPIGYPEKGFILLPKSMSSIIEGRIKKSEGRKGLLHLYFSLQCAKGLCQTVPEDFLRDGLLKHREGICRKEEDLIKKDENLFQKLKEYSSKKFGNIVQRLYNPYKTKIPNRSACIESSREKGGTFEFLKKTKQLHYSQKIYNLSEHKRIEPFVIGLFGPPGCGKTTLVQDLIKFISKKVLRIEYDNDSVYSRSCHLDHWDGYKHQPIVILDDFGQNNENHQDIIEFEQLISCNPYMLPMADLSEKGTYFNSPIVILTSNLQYGCSFFDSSTQKSPLADKNSVWRRISLPILLVEDKVRKISTWGDCPKYVSREKEKEVTIRRYNILSIDLNDTISMDQIAEKYYFGHLKSKPTNQIHNISTPLTDTMEMVQFYKSRNRVLIKDSFQGVDEIQQLILDLFQKRLHYHSEKILNIWSQDISEVNFEVNKDIYSPFVDINLRKDVVNNNSTSLKVDFPLYPPVDRQPIVQGIPLAEPLKVRVITKAEVNTRVLKPLQMAMWDSLNSYPEFSLTHGCKDKLLETKEMQILLENQIKIISENSEGLWLSGDYTAATDNIPIWVTEALLEGILEHIEHEPTKAWARYEISSHRVTYPKGYNIEEGQQTSGQLMGSLLSFPLLCMANDFLCSVLAKFPKNSYRINGDDIVAKVPLENIELWKQSSSSIGLSLSVGKNFIDKSFCTVNSQFFFECESYSTGKLSLIYRNDLPIGDTWSNFQRYYGMNLIFVDQFIQNNVKQLRTTPSSLWVPKSHGGLGCAFLNSYWHKRQNNKNVELSNKLSKEVYFFSLFRKIRVNNDDILSKLTNNRFRCIFIPTLNKNKNQKQLRNDCVLEKLESLFLPKKDSITTEFNQENISNTKFRKWNQKTFSKECFAPLRKICDNQRIKLIDLPPLDHYGFKVLFVPRTSDTENLNSHYLHNFIRDISDDFKKRTNYFVQEDCDKIKLKFEEDFQLPMIREESENSDSEPHEAKPESEVNQVEEIDNDPFEDLKNQFEGVFVDPPDHDKALRDLLREEMSFLVEGQCDLNNFRLDALHEFISLIPEDKSDTKVTPIEIHVDPLLKDQDIFIKTENEMYDCEELYNEVNFDPTGPYFMEE